MIEEIKEHVKRLLDEGTISAFLGLKDHHGTIVPHLYETSEDLDDGFSIGATEGGAPARYPMASLVMTIAASHENGKVGVLVRGCDERAPVPRSQRSVCCVA